MKRKSAKKSNAKPPADIEKVQRKIIADVFERDKLEKECKENPNEEKHRRIIQLTHEIEENQRISSAFAFPGIAEALGNSCEVVINLVAEKDERVFLNPDGNAFLGGTIQSIIAIRNNFYDFQRHFFTTDDARKINELFEEKISRLKQIIADKRNAAARQFPSQAGHLKPPDFEMPKEYKDMLAFVMQMVEKRDALVKRHKYVVPEKRKQYAANLAEMDKILNESEQKLAEVYERHQKKQHWLDGLRQMLKEASLSEMHSLREHVKEHPGEFPAMEKLLAEEFPEID